MPSFDWDKTQQQSKAAVDRDPSTPGQIVLESWIDGSKKPVRKRTFPTVLSAVSAAWAGRPARISADGVLSIVLKGEFGPYTIKQRIKAHGGYLSEVSWREMKAQI